MKIGKEENALKITLEEDDVAEFKGLDKNGNCYFKIDFTAYSHGVASNKIKLRIPDEVGFEMVLLMRDQLVKFMGTTRMEHLLNSKEKLVFNRLKEALVDNKDLVEKFNLKKSLEYNVKYFDKVGEKISDIELKQEEALVDDMSLQKKLQREKFLQLKSGVKDVGFLE